METTTRKRKSPTCRNCGEVGHRASSLECPKRSEYLQKRPPSKRRNAQQSRQRHSSAGSSYSARNGKASSSTSASKSSTSSSPSADLSKTNWIYIDVDPDGGSGAEQEQEEKFSPVFTRAEMYEKKKGPVFHSPTGRLNSNEPDDFVNLYFPEKMIEKWAYYSEDYRQRKAPISYRKNYCATLNPKHCSAHQGSLG